jgi:hypothetical protein
LEAKRRRMADYRVIVMTESDSRARYAEYEEDEEDAYDA